MTPMHAHRTRAWRASQGGAASCMVGTPLRLGSGVLWLCIAPHGLFDDEL